MVANLAIGGVMTGVETVATPVDFADAIQAAFFASDLSAAAFARRLETAPETVQNWREGVSTPSFARVLELSRRRLLPVEARRGLMLLIGDLDFLVVPVRAVVAAAPAADQASVLRLLVEAERAGCDARHLMQEAMADGVVTPDELQSVAAAVVRKESLLRRAWEAFRTMCRQPARRRS